jgi:rRNA pseudouridine-1189 N-methylase Emg1 (Nep1/Mra1 family)
MFNCYKTESYIATHNGLIVKLRPQLLIPSDIIAYNTLMNFILKAWRWPN